MKKYAKVFMPILSIPVHKGHPLMTFMLSNALLVEKNEILSGDLDKQNTIMDSILTRSPKWICQLIGIGEPGYNLLRRVNVKYMCHVRSNIFDVQKAMLENEITKYTQETQLVTETVMGQKITRYTVGNGHMWNGAKINEFILGTIARQNSDILSIDDPLFHFLHKVDGRSLIIRVENYLLSDGKIVQTIQVHSRTGPLIAHLKSPLTQIEIIATQKYFSPMAAVNWESVLPSNWIIDCYELSWIVKLAPILMSHVSLGQTIIYMAEGSGHNMDTLIDNRTRKLAITNTQSPSIFFFNARQGDEFISVDKLFEWGLPVTTIIPSPNRQSRWSIREVLTMMHNKDPVNIRGIAHEVPSMVKHAINYLLPNESEFSVIPIEGGVLVDGFANIKIKDPLKEDDDEKAEHLKNRQMR